MAGRIIERVRAKSEQTEGRRFWHGGKPGLKVGDRILPPSVTRTERTLLRYSEIDHPGMARRDRVYLTTDRQAGKAFAALYPKGALYRVEPEVPLWLDPDNLDGTSFECESAVIVAVYDPYVVMKPQRALRIMAGIS